MSLLREMWLHIESLCRRARIDYLAFIERQMIKREGRADGDVSQALKRNQVRLSAVNYELNQIYKEAR